MASIEVIAYAIINVIVEGNLRHLKTMAQSIASAATRASQRQKALAGSATSHNELEFFLTSNWILTPEGVDDFCVLLHSRMENPEIVYDTTMEGFRIRCQRKDEPYMMELVHKIMDQLVQEGIKEKAEGAAPNRVIHAAEWRSAQRASGLKHAKAYELHKFPRALSRFQCRETWTMPEELTRVGINARALLGGSALAQIQEVTKTVLFFGSKDLTVDIGARTKEELEAVKRKLSTMARYMAKPPSGNTFSCHLYGEEDTQADGELRFLAQTSKHLLRSYFLDPGVHDTSCRVRKSAYARIFEKGVVVKLGDPTREPWGEPGPSSGPAVREKGEARLPFVAFSEDIWTYKAKERSPIEDSQSSKTAQSHYSSKKGGELLSDDTSRPISQSTGHQIQPKQKIEAPEAKETPSVENWVDQLPEPEGVSQELLSNAQPRNLRATEPTTTTVDEEQEGNAARGNLEVSDQRLAAHEIRDSATDGEAERAKVTEEDIKHSQKPANDDQRGDLISVNDLQKSAVGNQATPNTAASTVDTEPTNTGVKSPLSTATAVATLPEADAEFHKNLGHKISGFLDPLRIFPGHVAMKVELGRMCFTKLNPDHVQRPGMQEPGKRHPASVLENSLSRHHIAPRTVMWSRIFTTMGGEVNALSKDMTAKNERVWQPHDRVTTYEVLCKANMPGNRPIEFFVDIDGITFDYHLRLGKPERKQIAVHCTKRTFDFMVTISWTPDLEAKCGRFAKELVRGMRVIPQPNTVPLLEFSMNRKAFDVDIRFVRVCNVASYHGEVRNRRMPESNELLANTLEITEVHDMSLAMDPGEGDDVTIECEQAPSDDRLGQPGTWYELALRSKQMDDAFLENQDLEIGEETSWSPEGFQKSGALAALLRGTTNLVKRVDGFGFWDDNGQDTMIHGLPPRSQQGPPPSSLPSDPYLQPQTIFW
ncbi:hypothetical protein F4780DRAFT_790994 [Xylariomycetidae sp. FL0641]|nr:hypothetical protein F4780DRAFT_790994 [Xylariomycetidae sp. FL0641]